MLHQPNFVNVALLPMWLRFGIGLIPYTLLGMMLILKRNELFSFYIDKNVIVLYLIAGPAFILFFIYVNLAQYYIPLIVLIMSLVIYKTWHVVFKKPWPIIPWKYILIGVFMGLVLRIIYAWILSILVPDVNAQGTCLQFTIVNLYRIFATAAIVEELFFRGFLTGILQQRGWRNGVICLIQTTLFVVPHYAAYTTTLLAFLTYLPFVSLFAWWLTMRSKTLVPAIIFHFANHLFLYLLACA